MATLASATMTRDNLAFIGSVLPALDDRFGIHARSSFAALVLLRNTKTDQTHGRSVALLAPLHPKCPFQVELLRVRASYCCFLVLGYYEVPGLYGCRTEPVNTAPYLSLQATQAAVARRRAARAWRSRSGRTARRPRRGPARSVEPQQGNLDVLGAWVDIKARRARLDPAIEVARARGPPRRPVRRSRDRKHAASRETARPTPRIRSRVRIVLRYALDRLSTSSGVGIGTCA